MSDQNQTEGYELYMSGDQESRDWFERQWQMWPKRADERNTTNLSFLYGGVLGHRALHARNPSMSDDFFDNVTWLDRHTLPPAGADDGIA